MTIEYDCRLCGHPWTPEHGKMGKPLTPLNYELLLLRTDILALIKRVAMAARQTRSGDIYWALNPILKQLTYIYRHNGGKV